MSTTWSRATLLSVLLVAVSVAVVLVATLPYGPALSPDSATYVAAARSLRAGRGYLDLDGVSPVLDFPPLYPALLAAGLLVGASVTVTATVVGALGLAGTALSVRHAAQLLGLGQRPALSVALLAVVLVPVVDSATSVLSESVFLCLSAVVACAVLHVSRGRDRRWEVVLVTALAAACLCRYLGVALAAGAGLALLTTGSRPLRGRLAVALRLPGLAVLPLAAWLVRNQVVGGSPTADDYGASTTPFGTHLRLDVEGLGGWWTGATTGPLTLAVGCLALVVLVGTLLPVRRLAAGRPVAVLVGSYLALVLLAQTLVGLDTDDRFLRPAAPLLPLLTVHLVRTMVRPRVRAVWGVPLVLVAAVSLFSLKDVAASASEDGLGDYDAQQWRGSDTLKALRAHRPPGTLVSNDAYAVSLLTALPVTESPAATFDDSAQTTGELQQFAQEAREVPVTLVWFDRPDIGGLETLARLRSATCLRPGVRYADARTFTSCS